MQNEPNPATGYTIIYFFLKHAGPASLRVYESSGRMVGFFFDDFLSSGWYSVGFFASILTDGRYYYRLAAPDIVDVKKMLVVK